jgi:hypothetical protein
MSSNCHLTCKSLDTSAPLQTLHYVQPRCAAKLYPSETLASSSASTPHLVVIEDEDAVSVADILWGNDSANLPPACPTVSPLPLPTASPSPSPTVDLGGISGRLESLTSLIKRLLPSAPVEDSVAPAMTVLQFNDLVAPATPVSLEDPPSPKLLSTMSRVDVIWLLHHEGTVLPLACPCDTTNSSGKKTNWSAEELHRAMGCRKFRNYKHLIQMSQDGTWVDISKFPPSLGSFATVPISNWGKPLDRTRYLYLNAVHVDIAFGDCLFGRRISIHPHPS